MVTAGGAQSTPASRARAARHAPLDALDQGHLVGRGRDVRGAPPRVWRLPGSVHFIAVVHLDGVAQTEGPEKQLLPLLKHSRTHGFQHVRLRERNPNRRRQTTRRACSRRGRGVSALPLGPAAESRADKTDVGSGRRQVQVSGRASWVTAGEGNGPSWRERPGATAPSYVYVPMCVRVHNRRACVSTYVYVRPCLCSCECVHA